MPRILKKTFRYLLLFILGFVAFVLLYLATAYCLSRIAVSKEPNQPEEVAIYIKTNGVHTDIVVPIKNEQFD